MSDFIGDIQDHAQGECPTEAAPPPLDAEDLAAIETKLSAARTRLILDKPFLGALVLRLPMRAASPNWCKTTATDARTFYYNPEYIEALSPEETQFMLAHEALHCALSHFARRQHRVRHKWDLACDYAINPLLIDDGLKPPPNALIMPLYRGMTAEEIYPLIDDNDQSETLDTHAYDEQTDSGGQQGDQASMDEREVSRQQRQSRADSSTGSQGRGQGSGGDQGSAAGQGQARGNASSQPEAATPPPPERSTSAQPPESQQPELRDEALNEQRPQTAESETHDDQETAPPKSDEQSPNTPAEDDSEPDAQQQPPPVQQQPPRPLTPDEREQLQVQWQQRMAGAAQQAMQTGKLGGELRRLIDHLLQPQLPWRMLLARYMNALSRDDYSWSRPSRREGDYLMPSLRSHQLDVVVALDVSGSIHDGEIQAFIEEIDALKAQVRARVTLLPCDSALCPGAPFTFEPWEQFQRPRDLPGGGGTDFRPVFDWIQHQGRQPDLLVYFTDAEGKFPEREPNYPTIWLVKGRSQIPWGQRIQLN